MRLLITGGCGFIGSHFVNHIIKRKDVEQLVNVDVMNYCADERNVEQEAREDPRYHFVKGDITDLSLMIEILQTHQPTHVVHFAAQSHVQTSFTDSLRYTYDNVLGTHTLLEAVRQSGCELVKFVHVSTDEVYGQTMTTQKAEESILCPTNPYAATKAGAELIAQAYFHSFRIPIIITRGNNVYGANQYPEKVIPKFIQHLQLDQPVTIQGSGSALRNFLHVSDVVNAFEIILERGVIGEIYNIGGDEDNEFTVRQVAEQLIKLLKPDDPVERWITYIEDRPFNDQRYHITNEKLKALGWSVCVPFEQGLKSLL